MKVPVLFFAFLATVSAEGFIEAQDPSMKDIAPETNEKRWHCSVRCYYGRQCQSGYYCDYYKCCRPNNQRPCSHHTHCPQGWYCDYNARRCKEGERRCTHQYHCGNNQLCVDGKCRKRECYYHNQCKQGHHCVSGICKPVPGLCTSDSSCKNTQCCAKYHPSNRHGQCKDLKKPNGWCPVKPDGYHCGCIEGYECMRYYNNPYWGQCKKPECASDSGCQKTHCCLGGSCKPRKKANERCPYKGPDVYSCGCIEGYECKRLGIDSYWGKCKKKGCVSDSACQKTHCCSGGSCKPRKKANEFCPHKGADMYHCGCIEGYFCKQYLNSHYWGKCEEEEPGSGAGD